MSPLIPFTKSTLLKGKVYRSSGNRSTNPYIVLASWNELYYRLPPTTLPDHALHLNSNDGPVDVHYYVSVICKFSSAEYPEQELQQEWTLARVSWLFPHPKRYQIGKPAELWCSPTLTESLGVHSFLPFNLIITRCAHAPFHLDDHDSLLVVVPL